MRNFLMKFSSEFRNTNSRFLLFGKGGKVAKQDITLDTVLQKRRDILEVARDHGLVNIRIFGSLARGEGTLPSDIDFLVDLEKGRSLLDLGGASVKLQELLGRKVDIVTERGLHWYLRDKILKEARPL
jgi:predicted nucleotidyltransferase